MVSDARSDARLKNITHLSVQGPSACYSLFAYLDKLPALTSLTVEGGHNCSRVLYLTDTNPGPRRVKLPQLASLSTGCQFVRQGLAYLICPSLTQLTICTTETSDSRNFFCTTDWKNHLTHIDCETITQFIQRSDCASTVHTLHIDHLSNLNLLYDLVPILSNLHTLDVHLFHHKGSTGLGDSLAISNLADSLFRLLSITANNPIYLPLLQRLSVNLQKEPRKLPQFDTVIRNNLNIAQLSQFCRSRLEPPNGVTLSPVLNRVCVRDQSQSPVDREEEPIDELRTWAKQNVPELDFRVWFDDT
ncbi:hypothetical protein BKA70DRAFT_1427410 [Coprinopsis sp. MPI-PUGE-AT-0042]|nr:hypothetical protein BKA70DRAFT_1427410 [Coprinopsis sp. MPI-PUGE-AT-0042]